jgi:hypothetical protein
MASVTTGPLVRPRHRALLMRLDGLLRELRTDPTVRRRLIAEAPLVLAERGFASDTIPARLPPARPGDLLLTHGQLFGLSPAAPLAEPPLELRLLAYGLKPVVLLHGQDDELRATLAWAEARGFTALLSAHEWDRGVDEGKGGYSNLATNLRRARGGASAWRSLLVGADEDATALAWLALALGWDELLGRLLGYPVCCTKSFPRRWAQAVASHQGDLVAACIDDSGPGPHDWRVNNLGRYFGAQLIQHFPCRFGCTASRDLATLAEAALAAWEPDHQASVRTVLEAPVLYAEAEGVAVLPGAEVEAGDAAWHLRYDPAKVLVSLADGALHQALRAASTLTARSGEREVEIGGHTLAARLVWFHEPAATA